MAFFINFFNLVLYQPLFNLLVLLYQYLPGKDFGVAIICLTLLIKILLYPLGIKAIKIQRTLQELQPKIKEIQEKYKNDRQKQTLETIELYKKEKTNPFTGLFVALVQVPILIALWRVFWGGFQPEKLAGLYSFLPRPESIDPTFLGILNLTQPSIFLAIFAGISQYFQTKMITPASAKASAGKPQQKTTPDFSQMMGKQMLYFFPIFTVFILWKLPAAIALYWLVTALFSIVQQYFVLKKTPL